MCACLLPSSRMRICNANRALACCTCASSIAVDDETVRSYALLDGQLAPRHTLPAFTGQPCRIVFEVLRPALFVDQYHENKQEVAMSVHETSAGWTAWRTLTRDDAHMQLTIHGMCMCGANSIAIFDYNSKSVRLYDLA